MSTVKNQCPCCQGNGFILVSDRENAEEIMCSSCDGSGVVWCSECDGEGCEECDWEGVFDDCQNCKGVGKIYKPVKHRDISIEKILSTKDIATLLVKKIFKRRCK